MITALSQIEQSPHGQSMGELGRLGARFGRNLGSGLVVVAMIISLIGGVMMPAPSRCCVVGSVISDAL